MRPFIVVAAVVLVIAAWTGFWFYSAGRAEQAVEDWAAAAGSDGVEVSYRGLEVGGFPFRLQLRLQALSVAWPGGRSRPVWQAEQITVIAHPWNYRHFIADVAGRQQLSFDWHGRRHTAVLDVARGLASLTGAPQAPERISFDLNELALALDAQPAADVARLQLHVRPGRHPDGLFDVAASLTSATLHQAGEQPLGGTVAGAAMQGTIKGDLRIGPVDEALAHWRDDGGMLELERLRLDWGALTADAEGSLALDGLMRPIGALTTRIRGHDRLIDTAVRAGQLPGDAAPAARTALDLLAIAGGGVLAVPVRLQDGLVFLGPVQIARVPPLL